MSNGHSRTDFRVHVFATLAPSGQFQTTQKIDFLLSANAPNTFAVLYSQPTCAMAGLLDSNLKQNPALSTNLLIQKKFSGNFLLTQKAFGTF